MFFRRQIRGGSGDGVEAPLPPPAALHAPLIVIIIVIIILPAHTGPKHSDKFSITTTNNYN